MSNFEREPDELECGAGEAPGGVEVIEPREVPLGGIRAMLVHRTLPTRERSMIGAWCFADHYGPDLVAESGGMEVLPHPHTGLQTVSWLFEGRIEHRDSTGVHTAVLPGEINLMSAGHGISHSEVSTVDTTVLHGMQLWLALPGRARDGRPGFQHHVPAAAAIPDVRPGHEGAAAKVFIGTLAGSTSPIETATPLLGAELVLAPGARVTIGVEETFEHGLIVDTDQVLLDGIALRRGALGYVGAGAVGLRIHNPSPQPARALLLGGVPFTEDIVMWWNFVARSHDEIVAFRAQWQDRAERFGTVAGWGERERIPAPPLPTARLKPRPRTAR